MLKSEAQFTRRITRVDADAKACASWKGKKTVLIFGQEAITKGFAACRALRRRTPRSSEHRSLHSRLRPTGAGAANHKSGCHRTAPHCGVSLNSKTLCVIK